MTRSETLRTRKAFPRRARRVLASAWVSFLAASAGLAPMISIIENIIDVTGGHQALPVPLALSSLVFFTLWVTALAACLMAFLLQANYRNRSPGGD